MNWRWIRFVRPRVIPQYPVQFILRREIVFRKIHFARFFRERGTNRIFRVQIDLRHDHGPRCCRGAALETIVTNAGFGSRRARTRSLRVVFAQRHDCEPRQFAGLFRFVQIGDPMLNSIRVTRSGPIASVD